MPKTTQAPWYTVLDTPFMDENGNGPSQWAITTDPEDVVDAIAWVTSDNPADAELIAAAPLLLLELRRLLNVLDRFSPGLATGPLVSLARELADSLPEVGYDPLADYLRKERSVEEAKERGDCGNRFLRKERNVHPN